MRLLCQAAALMFATTFPPGRVHSQVVHSPELQSYAIREGNHGYEVQIGGSGYDTVATISSDHGAKRKLPLPPPWSPEFASHQSQLPSVIAIRSTTPMFALVCKRQSGTWGIQSPVFFRLTQGRWRRLPVGPDKTEFSNRGSFLIAKNRLTVWDIQYDERLAHWAPQRYRLSIFTIGPKGLRLVQRRLTKKRYAGGTSEGDPDDPKPGEDPLVEFGTRWKWWGESIEHRIPKVLP